jgi:hypothetical protein
MGFFSDPLGLRKSLGLFQESGANNIKKCWDSSARGRTTSPVDSTTPYPSLILKELMTSAHVRAAKALWTPRTAVGTSFLGARATKSLMAAITPVQLAKAVLTTETATGYISPTDSTLEHRVAKHVDPNVHVVVRVSETAPEVNDSSEDFPDSIFTRLIDDSQGNTPPTSLTTSHTAPSEMDHADEDLFDDKQDRSSSGSSSRSSSPEDPDPDAVTEDLRADWTPIRAIPKDLFHRVLLQHLPDDHGVTVDEIEDTDEIQGGFNFVRIMGVPYGPQADRYVIKVPSTGTAARWQEADAYMLRSETKTMKYIRNKTGVRIPEILGFSDTLSNVLGAPYVVMRAADGVPANQIWYDRDEDGKDNLEDAWFPSEHRQKKRTVFLQSLAQQMARLQTLSFEKGGMLNFLDNDPNTPEIGPYYSWKSDHKLLELKQEDLSTPACLDCIQPYSTSKEYFMTSLERMWPRIKDATLDEDHEHNGRRHIMETILTSKPFDTSTKPGDKKETFVLRHNDLNFQNILCDPTGRVTGIIDWDECRAVPRCVGFSSIPIFLKYDWCPEWDPSEIHMPWENEEYRQIYASAMLKETGSNGDGMYTAKSHMYEAVHAALYGSCLGGTIEDVCQRIWRELPCARRFHEFEFFQVLGDEWDQGEWKVNNELRRLMRPGGVLNY